MAVDSAAQRLGARAHLEAARQHMGAGAESHARDVIDRDDRRRRAVETHIARPVFGIAGNDPALRIDLHRCEKVPPRESTASVRRSGQMQRNSSASGFARLGVRGRREWAADGILPRAAPNPASLATRAGWRSGPARPRSRSANRRWLSAMIPARMSVVHWRCPLPRLAWCNNGAIPLVRSSIRSPWNAQTTYWNLVWQRTWTAERLTERTSSGLVVTARKPRPPRSIDVRTRLGTFARACVSR
jgi:hypothetical protein